MHECYYTLWSQARASSKPHLLLTSTQHRQAWRSVSGLRPADGHACLWANETRTPLSFTTTFRIILTPFSFGRALHRPVVLMDSNSLCCLVIFFAITKCTLMKSFVALFILAHNGLWTTVAFLMLLGSSHLILICKLCTKNSAQKCVMFALSKPATIRSGYYLNYSCLKNIERLSKPSPFWTVSFDFIHTPKVCQLCGSRQLCR